MISRIVMTMALLLSAWALPLHAAPATPDQLVQEIADELATALEGRRDELKSDRAELIRTIDGILLPRFDIHYASLLVLGREARSATPAQRSRFARAFYQSIAHRYAEGLLNYSRGSVRVLPLQGALNEKRTIVRTHVVLDDGKLLPVDYAFRKTRDGDWKAYDVIIEGISYITNYRNQVAAEISKTSLDALIERLESGGEDVLDELEEGQAH